MLIDKGNDVKAVSHGCVQENPESASVICSVRQLGHREEGGVDGELEEGPFVKGFPAYFPAQRFLCR